MHGFQLYCDLMREIAANNRPAWTIARTNWFSSLCAYWLIRKHSLAHGNMVRRSWKSIRENYFLVALDRYCDVQGVIGLMEWDCKRVELISHIVREECRGQGVGLMLFTELLKEIRLRHPTSLFLCTTEVKYYQKLGFEISTMDNFTDKVRSDCKNCSKGPLGPGFFPCPEVPMVYNGKL